MPGKHSTTKFTSLVIVLVGFGFVFFLRQGLTKLPRFF